MLDTLFASLARRTTESVFVFGRTGMGKTTLIRSFLDDLIEKDDAIVLSGRCYERESVPYKALDSLIDALRVILRVCRPGTRRACAARRGLSGSNLPRASGRGGHYVGAPRIVGIARPARAPSVVPLTRFANCSGEWASRGR